MVVIIRVLDDDDDNDNDDDNDSNDDIDDDDDDGWNVILFECVFRLFSWFYFTVDIGITFLAGL